MIIKNDGTMLESNSLFPDTNWYDDKDERMVVDDTTELADTIKNNYPYFDLVIENNEVVDVVVYPQIQATIDKTTITIDEITTISVQEPEQVEVFIDHESFGIDTDGFIEYQDGNVDSHRIELKANKYKPAIFKVEVTE